jgi:DNA end-binding protein Ku
MPATVWKGYLSFGLVSFPVRLFAAARAETVHFHMLHKKDWSRIREVWYCVEEDKPVDRGDIVKGYEYRKGKYVVVEDAELKKAAPVTATSMDILQFVKNDGVDPIYLEKSYYLVPERSTAKPYALLRKAMQDTSYQAVAKVAMHGREHIVLIRPTDDGMVLHTLYFVKELHKANAGERVSNQKFSAKEVELARRLIDTLAAPFRPEKYKDEYRENVERLLEQKRKGQKITVVEQPKTAPVVDIMDALRRSLESPAKKKRASRRPRKAA